MHAPSPSSASSPPAAVLRPRSSGELLVWALATLRRELGLEQVMFALASPERQWLRAKWMAGIAPDSPLAGLTLSLGRAHLFAQLPGKPQTVWLHDANRANLAPFRTADLTRLVGRGDFHAMSIFLKDKLLGLLYADARGGTRRALDADTYRAFKQLAARVSQGLQQRAAAPRPAPAARLP